MATLPNVWAQDWPTKPLRIVVPLPPGSPPDSLARILADRLQIAWKQPVVVENKPGATGMIGLDAVARSAPDGYTVGVMFLTHTVLPAMFGKVPYDTATAFAPIANLVWLYNVLAVPPSSPLHSVADLITLARQKPNELSYGSGGNGSPAHLIGASFCKLSGIKLLHVPFQGPAAAVQSLMSGDISAMFATTSTAVQMVRAGKLRALAVTSPERLPALADVPTLTEVGIRGFEMKEWEGIVAPTGTPAERVAAWNTELNRIMALPGIRERIGELGMTAAGANTPAQFTSLVGSELQHWTQFVHSENLQVNKS
ncbi:Bug family tripartite tricarboxylate transporter substrate binding protein [Ottowia sp.]|uniref:Bug family tripartite tricarboxylate transporter substrate binding protein n=1 Tax=Ottowia sp. TaxID=1898956 RepID=UPI0039648B77